MSNQCTTDICDEKLNSTCDKNGLRYMARQGWSDDRDGDNNKVNWDRIKLYA